MGGEREIKTRNRGEEEMIYDELMKMGVKLQDVRVEINPELFTWEPTEEDLSQNWYISGVFLKRAMYIDNILTKQRSYTVSLMREDGRKILNGISIVNPKTRVQEIYPIINDEESTLIKLKYAKKEEKSISGR